jgi:hypothetical protein
MKDENTKVVWKPMKPADSIVEKFKVDETKEMYVYVNKSPVWNDGTYTVHCYGRTHVYRNQIVCIELPQQS